MKSDLENKKNIFILSLGFATLFLGYNSFQQYFTSIFSSYGLERIAFIALIAIYVFFSIGTYFSTIIIHKIGVKRAILFSAITYPLLIALTITKNPIIIILGSIVMGLAAGTLWTSQAVYLLKTSPTNQFGKTNGIFWSSMGIGSTIGVLGSSFLAKIISTEQLTIIWATIMVIGIFILSRIENNEFKEAIKPHLSEIIKDRAIVYLSIAAFPLYMVLGFVIGKFPILISERFGIASVGLITFVYYIMPVVVPYTTGRLSDYFKREIFLTASLISGMLGMVLVFFAQTFRMYFVAALFLALSMPMGRPIANAMIGDLFHNQKLGNAIALFRTITTLAGPSALLLGYLLEFRTFLIVALILFTLAFIPLLLFFKEYNLRMKNKKSN